MSARHLILGLDGGDLTLIETLGKERLPRLHALMEEGAYAALESVFPPATLPNWTTFLTGVDPGVHGVFDFTIRDGTSVRFAGGTVRAVPTIAARLDALGHACAIVGFPGTWPPEPLQNGFFVSGWDSPVAFEADRSFVHPPWLHGELARRFSSMRFDSVDEFLADASGWHTRLVTALERRIEDKVRLAKWMLTQRRWELAAFYFGESDTAAHHLWSLYDRSSPRYVPGAEDGLPRVYQALDRAVGELIDAARSLGAGRAAAALDVTIVSDHGSGGSSDKVLYLNRALEEAGLLAFREGDTTPFRTQGFNWIKDQALTRLSPRARDRVFRFGSRSLPGWLESRARFGAIDFTRTKAFSDELNYFPSVHLNLLGREPLGIVTPDAKRAVVAEVEEALRALRDPWSGHCVVEKVLRRDALFEGPHVGRAPDLLLQLHLDNNYSYNLQPSGGAPPGTGPWRRLAREEALGRKGRSLPGSHRPHGLFIAVGPSVAPVGRIDAAIADATATLLERMGVEQVPDGRGRVLFEILTGDGKPRTDRESLTTATPSAQRDAREAPSHRLVDRLRALGYVD